MFKSLYLESLLVFLTVRWTECLGLVMVSSIGISCYPANVGLGQDLL